MKRSEIFFGLIRLPLDFLLSMGAFLFAYRVRAIPDIVSLVKNPDLGIFPKTAEFFELALFGAILLIIILAFFQLYSLKITHTFGTEARKIVVSVSIWLMAVITYYFLIREFPFSRLILLYSWFFACLFLILGRGFVSFIQKLLLRFGVGKRRMVIIGEGKILEHLKNIFERKGMYEMAGMVFSLESLRHLNRIDEVIQTKTMEHARSNEVLNYCREHHIEYHFVPDILEVSRSNVSVMILDGIPLITLKKTSLEGWGKVLKRTFDIVFSVILLLLLLPIFLLIAIVIKLDSSGPIFFWKIFRIGQFGKKFYCWKFRTMKTGTHHLRYSSVLQSQNVRYGSPLVKIENDPRITRVGKFLRKFSLDELPQLWNVFRGEMSLVGPRPHLAEEVEKYEGHHKFVHTIKPGITGLAQISGRSDLPFEEEIRLDTFYIEHWSLWLDIKILLKTIFVVFRGYRE